MAAAEKAAHRYAKPPLVGKRTLLYASAGFLLGASLTVGGYLVDYYALYEELPSEWSTGLLRGLHGATPVHYFADMFAIILAVVSACAGWFQDRVVFYSNRLEELVEVRTRDLARSEQRYALAVNGSHDGIWDWDLDTGVVYYSPRWLHMAGLPPENSGNGIAVWLERVHPEDAPGLQERLEAAKEGASEHLIMEYRMRHTDGSYRWMLGRGVAVRDVEGRPERMAGSQTDIHQRREMEQQLRHLALHDQLTDLPNRTVLLDRIPRALRRSIRQESHLGVLYLGIDRFRMANETFGHSVADDLLVRVASRMRTAVSEFEKDAEGLEGSARPLTATLFRVGSDEFVVLLEDTRSLRDATRLADALLQAYARPLDLEDQEVLMSVSIGISAGPGNYSRADEIIRDAQTAMNRAKTQGRARYEVFDREMLVVVEDKIHLETELFQAIEKEELQLWFQPVVNLESGNLAGFEALVRWEHPEHGLIMPGRFIPLAEETGLIVRMSRWMFCDAFHRINDWRQRFPAIPELTLNMNLSPKYLFHPALLSDITAFLDKTDKIASHVHLEVTEGSFIDRPEKVAGVLERLKEKGFSVAIDDFGTGFSSLSMLHELPVDILKIDMCFVARLEEDPDARKIIETITRLADHLCLDVVAEGIETEQQLKALKTIGCKYGQGFLLGRPMCSEDAEQILVTESERRLTHKSVSRKKGRKRKTRSA